MVKPYLISFLCLMTIAIPVLANAAISQTPRDVEKWFKNLPNFKEKTTKFHFFFHDTLSGPNPTAVPITRPKNNFTTKFGEITMADDPLTVGPNLKSKIIGRAQGFYAPAAQNEVALLLTFNLMFVNGKFNGSTLSLVGRNPVFNEYREMSIIGGSGDFRLARGIATAKTYFLNTTTNDAIVEYHVTVLHY